MAAEIAPEAATAEFGRRRLQVLPEKKGPSPAVAGFLDVEGEEDVSHGPAEDLAALGGKAASVDIGDGHVRQQAFALQQRPEGGLHEQRFVQLGHIESQTVPSGSRLVEDRQGRMEILPLDGRNAEGVDDAVAVGKKGVDRVAGRAAVALLEMPGGPEGLLPEVEQVAMEGPFDAAEGLDIRGLLDGRGRPFQDRLDGSLRPALPDAVDGQDAAQQPSGRGQPLPGVVQDPHLSRPEQEKGILILVGAAEERKMGTAVAVKHLQPFLIHGETSFFGSSVPMRQSMKGG